MGIVSFITDDFGEVFGGSVVDYIFNGTKVNTGLATQRLNDGNMAKSYALNAFISSTTNNAEFVDEFLKRTMAPAYRNFVDRYEKHSYEVNKYANPYVRLSVSKEDEVNKKLVDLLPLDLVTKVDYGNPESVGITYTRYYKWGSGFLGTCRLGNWVFAQLYEHYHFDYYWNNLTALSYKKMTKVKLEKTTIYLPGSMEDYDYKLFDLESVPRVRLSDASIEEENHGNTSLFDFVFYSEEEERTPSAVVLCVWDGGQSEITFDIPEDVLTRGNEFWQVPWQAHIKYGDRQYSVIGGSSSTLHNQYIRSFWVYRKGSGIYPEWDALESNWATDDDESTLDPLEGNYLRNIPAAITYGGGFVLDEPEGLESHNYKSWEKQAKQFGLSPYETATKLKDTLDLTDVHRSALEFAVPLDTDDPLLNKYLFKLFETWEKLFQDFPLSRIASTEDVTTIRYGSYLRREYSFSMVAKQTNIPGRFDPTAKQGSYGSVLGTFTETITRDISETPITETWTGIQFFYQATKDAYVVIRVGSPGCVYRSKRRKKFAAQANDERFLLPINMTILKDFGTVDFETIMHKSFRLTHLIAKTRRISFTETEFFQETVEWIQETTQITFAVAGIYNIAVGYGLNLLMAALVYAAIQVAINEVIEFVIQELGSDVGIALAVIAVAVGAYSGVNGQVFFNGLIDGTMLINVANGLVSAAQQAKMDELQGEYIKLQDDYESLSQTYQDIQEEHETALDMLGTQYDIDPFLFIGSKPITIPGEEPQAFYTRTIHSGNIGTKAFDMVHNYVEENLKLPAFKDSVGDTLYV